jgi:hypothetical protein
LHVPVDRAALAGGGGSLAPLLLAAAPVVHAAEQAADGIAAALWRERFEEL